MAWYTEQVLADFLNHKNNHKGASKMFLSFLDDNVILEHGGRTIKGKKDVFAFFDEIYRIATADENGFFAFPVTTCEEGKRERMKAVALFSKLEVYISWLFRIRQDAETWKIISLKSEKAEKFNVFYNIYQALDYDDDGNSIELFDDNGETIHYNCIDFSENYYESQSE